MDRRITFFTAPGCASCASLKPHLKKLREECGMRIEEIDVQANPGVVGQFDIRTLPTLYLFKDGATYEVLAGYSERVVQALYRFAGLLP